MILMTKKKFSSNGSLEIAVFKYHTSKTEHRTAVFILAENAPIYG